MVKLNRNLRNKIEKGGNGEIKRIGIVLKTSSGQPCLGWRVGINGLMQRRLEQGWGLNHGCTASYHACPGTLLTLNLSSSYTGPVVATSGLLLALMSVKY